MRIVLDNIVFFLQRSGGGSVYWHEIVKRIINDTEFTVSFIEPNRVCNNRIYNQQFLSNFTVVKENGNVALSTFRKVNTNLNEKHLFHSSYYRISNSPNAINVLTIHDFTPEKHMSGVTKYSQILRKKLAIKKADIILCVSENTKKDLFHYYPSVPKDKVHVVYNGVSDSFYPLTDIPNIPKLPVDLKNEKYILYIGHRTNYKNFDFVVNVLAKCPNYKLIVIGEAFTEKEAGFVNKELPNRVMQIKGASTEEINVLYNTAHCLLYPSNYEGFGIPVVEAMKAGCPVIALNRSSIPEVAGYAGLLLDSLNVDDCLGFINHLEDLEYRGEVVAKGFEHSKKFSWDKSYRELVQLYKKVYINE